MSEAYIPDARPGAITADVADPILKRGPGRIWWICLVVSLALTGLMVVSLVVLVTGGIGIWGINTSNVWGFALVHYVWWIGIGNAGTLISAMLLLTRQHWRTSINRFAEAMTLFAACIAGLFPIFHLGRPWLFYWLVPYPNTLGLVPQWRSPLVWDFFAIASYILFSLMFWYTGAIPDFATMRDRAKGKIAQIAYGILALGWRGSARHWKIWQSYYGAMAAMGVPLVVSVHSVVGMDYAAGIAPGWNVSIYPPYFVVGAMFSGFAVVVVLAAIFRRALNAAHMITDRHFDVMGKILLTGSLIMTVSYATEWFYAWYSGEHAEQRVVADQLWGDFWPIYWAMLLGNCIFPQLYWIPKMRTNLTATILIAIGINFGMWFERVVITVIPPARGFLPSQWSFYWPTFWDWSLFLGTLGFFTLLFTLFLRVIPAISAHEMKEHLGEEKRT
ncbi:NrfD/PsrC family molybdoenzyme membrane anchor subunit [Roseivivax sediminis]|uniref:Prokaryotic molybdopterin-containing oxidoreductase family, membrane subunit n=1 Tax=Roseivivax sediminis TaxID=936889 RepID=A0A1I1X8B4_9RHOB|nr:NrfD/PsrC family molybdoenzyme membrane anchor subunit [Roseivivax sediminis]SFE01943.1 prokaryotic molybdopterin-containing oxidoreductase family, membrane subunit [Roseivivax sediminis]